MGYHTKNGGNRLRQFVKMAPKHVCQCHNETRPFGHLFIPYKCPPFLKQYDVNPGFYPDTLGFEEIAGIGEYAGSLEAVESRGRVPGDRV